ncbi:hypothetical protein AB0J28_00455 [Streptosporangium canum]|uniref:hypothetical protein n=1 Tax=Streptosporangium canum TaxID=324952 RepID=UPI003447DFFB
MTPTEELRTAAAKLREAAKSTTPGPWATADCELYPRWILSETATEPESPHYAADVAKSYSDDDGLSISDADWAWMAFASPALAEPLAALFDHYAAKYERLSETFGHPVTKPSDRLAEDKPQLHIDFALAVARAILGGTA